VTPYDWPRTHHWGAWALRVKLEALCRLGEAKQGWIPCRVVRRVIGR
jgi:hypothetical protein